MDFDRLLAQRGVMSDDALVRMLADYESVLTPEEVAELLRVHKQVIYRWLNDGSLPGHKLGKSWRILREDLVQWLRDRRNDQGTAEDREG